MRARSISGQLKPQSVAHVCFILSLILNMFITERLSDARNREMNVSASTQLRTQVTYTGGRHMGHTQCTHTIACFEYFRFTCLLLWSQRRVDTRRYALRVVNEHKYLLKQFIIFFTLFSYLAILGPQPLYSAVEYLRTAQSLADKEVNANFGKKKRKEIAFPSWWEVRAYHILNDFSF